MIQWNKRGLEIPVTMIVVLIIAIVTLGLVIGFIRTFFPAVTGQIGGELAKLKDQMREDLKTGQEQLKTSFGSRLIVKQGEPMDVAYGLKNPANNPNGESVCYLIGIKCVTPFDEDGFCTENTQYNVYVGGQDLSLDPPQSVDQESWVTLIERGGKINVLNRDVKVGDIRFQVPAAKDSYTMQLEVLKARDNLDCDNTDGQWDRWKTIQFTLEVT